MASASQLGRNAAALELKNVGCVLPSPKCGVTVP